MSGERGINHNLDVASWATGSFNLDVCSLQNTIIDVCHELPEKVSCNFHITQQSSDIEQEIQPYAISELQRFQIFLYTITFFIHFAFEWDDIFDILVSDPPRWKDIRRGITASRRPRAYAVLSLWSSSYDRESELRPAEDRSIGGQNPFWKMVVAFYCHKLRWMTAFVFVHYRNTL